MRYERTCLRNWRILIKRLTSNSPSDWKSKIVQHNRQSDGQNCGPLILMFAEMYLQQKDISSVETAQETNTEFRRQIAIVLMKKSGNNFLPCSMDSLGTCEDNWKSGIMSGNRQLS
ncbi:hypothetical protein G0U57_016369 [Chelydra serpentina]|uniref:Ubiquitin-like protease family profile domain-containing protein n=1 Tax=Chelydra serpentina TaxID=8475 RepID=A0A8T1RW65_CHESE|nr:hypothetical protein G0U57_016369 [Chelydra serpentina]